MNPTIDQSTVPSTDPSATAPPFGPTPARCIAVMAYTCNLILHSHRAIDIENKIAANAPQEIIFDLPRPKRDDDDPPHAPPSHPIWHTSTTERTQT
jgi:hypothetical protein